MKMAIKTKYNEFLASFIKVFIKIFQHPKKERYLFLKYIELKLDLIDTDEYLRWMEMELMKEIEE